jgi:hypothetical protein
MVRHGSPTADLVQKKDGETAFVVIQLFVSELSR